MQARLYLRGGSVLPLGPVIQHTGEHSDDPLSLLVGFDGQGRAEGRMYDDDGEGFAYRKGDYRLAKYRVTRRADGTVVVQQSADGNRAAPPGPAMRVLVVGPSGQQSVPARLSGI